MRKFSQKNFRICFHNSLGYPYKCFDVSWKITRWKRFHVSSVELQNHSPTACFPYAFYKHFSYDHSLQVHTLSKLLTDSDWFSVIVSPTPHAVLMPCALGVTYNGQSGQAWRAKWFPCAIHEKIATGFSDGEQCLNITLLLVKWLQFITGNKTTYDLQTIL